jgi:hypothetical protein
VGTPGAIRGNGATRSACGATVLQFTALGNPFGVAVDDVGSVPVTDQGINRVLKLPAR